MSIWWHPHPPIYRPDFQINGFHPIFHTANKKWSLTRSWGRMGTKGRHLIVWLASKEEAEQMYERTRQAKLRRGYQPTLFPLAPSINPPTLCRQDTLRKSLPSSQRPTPPQRTSAGQ